MSNRSKILGLIIAITVMCIVIALVFVISHMIRTDPKRAILVHGKMPVKLSQAKIETIHDIIGASGQTQEFERVILTARITQPVVSVRVKIGDKVKKGQILVEFEKKLLKAIINEAKESLNKSMTNLDYKKLNYNRLLNLYNQNLIAKAELEKADEQVKIAQWEYSQAIHQSEKAMQDLDYATVKSSITGIILEKSINPGETPKLDAPLVILGIIDDIFMMAKVAEDKISYVQLNQEVEVSFDSFRNEVFKGTVTKIDPVTEPKTRTFIAYIKIHNKGLRLTPGLTGFARIKNYKTSLAVPAVSIINPVGETATVFVVDSNSIVHIRRVKIGVSAGGFTEIVEGLREGETVVTAGIEFLKDGDRINVMGGDKS